MPLVSKVDFRQKLINQKLASAAKVSSIMMEGVARKVKVPCPTFKNGYEKYVIQTPMKHEV
jgi:hypothetical protein